MLAQIVLEVLISMLIQIKILNVDSKYNLLVAPSFCLIVATNINPRVDPNIDSIIKLYPDLFLQLSFHLTYGPINLSVPPPSYHLFIIIIIGSEGITLKDYNNESYFNNDMTVTDLKKHKH